VLSRAYCPNAQALLAGLLHVTELWCTCWQCGFKSGSQVVVAA
jgi:hypothetical protein